MSAFIDTSMWYAGADSGARSNDRAKRLPTEEKDPVTSDHVLVGTWVLLRHRLHHQAAERFWEAPRSGAAIVEAVTSEDLEVAWSIGERYADQEFSIMDRTSFAVMQRLGIRKALALDDDFAVFWYGRKQDQVFEVVR